MELMTQRSKTQLYGLEYITEQISVESTFPIMNLDFCKVTIDQINSGNFTIFFNSNLYLEQFGKMLTTHQVPELILYITTFYFDGNLIIIFYYILFLDSIELNSTNLSVRRLMLHIRHFLDDDEGNFLKQIKKCFPNLESLDLFIKYANSDFDQVCRFV